MMVYCRELARAAEDVAVDLKKQQHASSAKLLAAFWHRLSCYHVLSFVREWRACARYHYAHLAVSAAEVDVLPWHIAELMCCDIPEALMSELVSVHLPVLQ